MRKLRRRPRSCDKIDNSNVNETLSTLSSVKENHPSTSSDESKYTSMDNLNSVGKVKKTERNSISSDDSANIDLKNNSTLYGKILNRSQNDLSDVNKYLKSTITIHGEIASGEPLTREFNSIGSELKPSTSTANINTLSIRESDDNSNRCAYNKVKDDDENVSENRDCRSGKHYNEKVESTILMFGCDVPKPAIDDNLELSSDQDSTAGEDEEFTNEEDIENLHPEMLLYKAAAAHNLPVMCAALAAGADKLWSNVNDKSRSALHQAIISVRTVIFYII